MEEFIRYKVQIEEDGKNLDKYIYAYNISDAEEKASALWGDAVMGVTVA